jgi:hypothetical protein
MGKVCQILALFGIQVTPGGLYQAIGRLSRAAEPTYQALILAVRGSAAVSADETGWRVGGSRWWLWVFAPLPDPGGGEGGLPARGLRRPLGIR